MRGYREWSSDVCSSDLVIRHRRCYRDWSSDVCSSDPTGIAWTHSGVIATASHVVERDEDLWIGLGAGERLAAQIIGREPTTHLAALQVEGAEVAAAGAGG